MFAALANPLRFMAFSRWAAPLLGILAAALIGAGLVFGSSTPYSIPPVPVTLTVNPAE